MTDVYFAVAASDAAAAGVAVSSIADLMAPDRDVDGSGPWSGATVGSATGGPQNDLDGPPVQLVGLAIEPSLVL